MRHTSNTHQTRLLTSFREFRVRAFAKTSPLVTLGHFLRERVFRSTLTFAALALRFPEFLDGGSALISNFFNVWHVAYLSKNESRLLAEEFSGICWSRGIPHMATHAET